MEESYIELKEQIIEMSEEMLSMAMGDIDSEEKMGSLRLKIEAFDLKLRAYQRKFATMLTLGDIDNHIEYLRENK